MQWQPPDEPAWTQPIENRRAKEQIARALAGRVSDRQIIGVGSGSTAFLALLAVAARVRRERFHVECVPTSLETESYCAHLGLTVTTLVSARPDWCFDGADEIDPDHNMIKGRGGAFLREQLVFAAARERIIIADESKRVAHLGASHPIPLAVVPEATSFVRWHLRAELGVEPQVRPARAKDGGVITEGGFSVLDLPVDGSIAPRELEARLVATPGIIATGLFVGYEFEVISQ